MEKAKIITKLIEEAGYSKRAFAEKIGIPPTTLQSMLSRGVGKASIDNVIKVCKGLGITTDTLDKMATHNTQDTSSVLESKERHNILDLIRLPIVGSISCGAGVLAYEDIEAYKEVPRSWVNGEEHFFLRAKGDSMINARIEDGDLLLIRKQETFENGEIIAVMVEDEAYLKRIYRTDHSLFLHSENPKYPPMILNEDSKIKIIGKLKTNFIEY